MFLSSCISHPLISPKISHFGQPRNLCRSVEVDERFTSALKTRATDHPSQQARFGAGLLGEWSFARGTRLVISKKVSTFVPFRKSFEVQASWLTTSQIASSMFTLGTAAVLPFYTLMVFAPKAELLCNLNFMLVQILLEPKFFIQLFLVGDIVLCVFYDNHFNIFHNGLNLYGEKFWLTFMVVFIYIDTHAPVIHQYFA
ncbi:uncharacterized protein LOC120190636 isoform X2 [Hibiscus syriacus]|uniref:uncharacterized protein LOC120190636 isoform X2 n=1 Tax=Hibiscus syriacus TaxID=106335 RepID=UPI0019232AB6|nr:uncharacterized protein LOC120190636 isoform X2 [Hibiscus syriacus]